MLTSILTNAGGSEDGGIGRAVRPQALVGDFPALPWKNRQAVPREVSWRDAVRLSACVNCQYPSGFLQPTLPHDHDDTEIGPPFRLYVVLLSELLDEQKSSQYVFFRVDSRVLFFFIFSPRVFVVSTAVADACGLPVGSCLPTCWIDRPKGTKRPYHTPGQYSHSASSVDPCRSDVQYFNVSYINNLLTASVPIALSTSAR